MSCTTPKPVKSRWILKEELPIVEQVGLYIPSELGNCRASRDSISDAVCSAYQGRAYKPIWISGSGVSHFATDLMESLHEAESNGLSGEDYYAEELWKLLTASTGIRLLDDQGVRSLAKLDYSLTKIFFQMTSDIVFGRVLPNLADTDWSIKTKEFQLSAVPIAQMVLSGRIPHLKIK